MSSTTASTSSFQLILDALDEYAKQTGIDLTKNPFVEVLQNCNSPDSVIQLLQDRAQAFKDYRDGNHKLINWLSPAVQVLHEFSGILSEVAGLVPFQPAKLVFVGIDALLTAAIGVTASYDALVDLFECVGNFLNRLRIYTEIPFNSTMTGIIVKMLVEVLSVLALATKQIKQGRFKKFAKRLLGESEIESVLQRLDRLTQDEARMTAAQTLEVVHGLVNNMKVVMDDGRASADHMRQALVTMQEITNEINKMKRDQLQERIRNWLSPPDPSENHNIARTAHHSGTCAWFTQGSTFEEWKATGSLLWIHGKPGSGKSVLCSTIIQEAQALSDAGLALVSYFYCDFKAIAKQDIRGLLTSLLSQLCAKSDPCYHVLCDLYSRHDAGSRQPDDHALIECLKKMLTLPGQPMTYVIVDGLDECPNTSGLPTAREKVLDLLEDLVTLKLPNLRICVTSRPEFDIKIVLEPLASLRISLHDENGQKSDILDYVSTIVRSDRKMRRWRAEDKQLVIDTLCEKVNGMFRWVFCQLEMLRGCLPAAIRRALEELPESLDETYQRTLLGIEKRQRDYAHRLFQCLTVAAHPLRVEELADVLAIRFDRGQLPEYHVDWRLEDPQEAVMRACSTLIMVVDVDGSQVIQFSHFSVKEFLTSDRLAIAAENFSRYYILPNSAHTILAQACLSVLLHLDDHVDKTTMKNFPLALYAAQHWVDHAQFEDVSSRIEDQMECLFDANKSHFATWVWIYDIDDTTREPMFGTHPTQPEAVPLYYATLCGFDRLVTRLVIAHSGDVSVRGGYYYTPLHAAIAKGYIKIARLLLEHGANANALDDEELSPLQMASRAGRHEIVELLLGHHADVNKRDEDGETPLDMASSDGALEVTRILLSHGAPVDSRDNDGWTPLHSASRFGHLEIVQLLLRSGADLNTQEVDSWTPLHLASNNGHLSVAELLIQRGAEVDKQNEDKETPLDRAAVAGQLEIARLLVKSGSNANSRDSNGWTPLHTAARNGHLGIVTLLLDSGADVNVLNGSDETPLDLASARGKLVVARFLAERMGRQLDTISEDPLPDLVQSSPDHEEDTTSCGSEESTPSDTASEAGDLEALRSLLDQGADVDERNESNQTRLQIASEEGKLEVAKLLIQHRADVNSRQRFGWTPLHLASREEHTDVVRLLLEHGADINAKLRDHCTPLHIPSYDGHLKIVRQLLEQGANLHLRDDEGRTPHELALRRGHREIARLLLEYGTHRA